VGEGDTPAAISVNGVARGTRAAVALLLLAACARAERAEPTTTAAAITGVATTTGVTTTIPVTTNATPTIPATTVTAADTTTVTEAVTATTPAVRTNPPGPVDRSYDIGRSLEGRPITVVERGTLGGKVVLVVGVIHGNETAGVQVVRDLVTAPVPEGIHLYLVESMNPDGQAHDTRTNAHEVDLNRNFPLRWAPLGQPGDWEYGGPGPASEPETQAMVALTMEIQPELAIWYHQDLNRLSPATGEKGELVERYSELTGLPIMPVTGGTYTGTASPWQESVVPGSAAFIVELGSTVSDEQAATHAAAVLDIAAAGT
jgi:murein peptide amidase A